MLRPSRFGKCRDSTREESVTNDFSQTVIEFGLGFILFMMFLTAAVTFIYVFFIYDPLLDWLEEKRRQFKESEEIRKAEELYREEEMRRQAEQQQRMLQRKQRSEHRPRRGIGRGMVRRE